ncbi:histidine kinase [Actinoplanes sp. SE50]|uniref:sensor histidine kinase n=1 Tax=unclassified Actinoplanes TaxID=2626549 RepID=UPI00023ECC71|nr:MULTISPECIES: HAMP domain-containing sensor histidine kinase [unclassified Actinoplanes]AEV83215.1 Sensor kinase protein rcsC [Actinoplanes sp. SE50/110]ATO81610.1 histidine kinase [Actinoplanes sp. SE50]SLL99018.1 two-component system sensor kinase [Actinoplanes sp. SE50/110]
MNDDIQARQRLRRHNRALAELAATKTELVSALLHELRTPLTAALGMLEMLPEQTGDPLLDEALPMIARNLRRIERSTAEIATISGIESGSLPLDRISFDLPALLGEVALAAGAECSADPATGLITGDPARLGEVFSRLLAAVRALNGPAAIEATLAGTEWHVAFPLPEGQASDRLFTSGGAGGNAMALILARAVAGRHGGSVGVHSAGGTAYLRIVLPV